MYRSKRKLPAEQKADTEDALRKIQTLADTDDWLVCLDSPRKDGQRSILRGLGSNRYGRVDTVASVIYVDYRKDFLAMFVHQCIHAIYPNMLERDVTILELVIIENIDSQQAVNLLRLMLDNSIHRLPGNPKFVANQKIQQAEPEVSWQLKRLEQ